jgi:hypothetical protein
MPKMSAIDLKALLSAERYDALSAMAASRGKRRSPPCDGAGRLRGRDLREGRSGEQWKPIEHVRSGGWTVTRGEDAPEHFNER